MWGIVQKDSIERLIQKIRNLTTRVETLEDGGGGPPPGSSVTMGGDILGNSSSTVIGSIKGQPLMGTLSMQGQLLTYDVGQGGIAPVSPATDQNSVLVGDPFLDQGMSWKALNILPNILVESALFGDYTMNTGIQFFSLNFNSIVANANLTFPPINETSVTILINIVKTPGFKIIFTPDGAESFEDFSEIENTTEAINFLAIPNTATNSWRLVKLYLK